MYDEFHWLIDFWSLRDLPSFLILVLCWKHIHFRCFFCVKNNIQGVLFKKRKLWRLPVHRKWCNLENILKQKSILNNFVVSLLSFSNPKNFSRTFTVRNSVYIKTFFAMGRKDKRKPTMKRDIKHLHLNLKPFMKKYNNKIRVPWKTNIVYKLIDKKLKFLNNTQINKTYVNDTNLGFMKLL